MAYRPRQITLGFEFGVVRALLTGFVAELVEF